VYLFASAQQQPAKRVSASVLKDEELLFEAAQTALDHLQYDDAIRIYNKLLIVAAKDRQTMATVHVKNRNCLRGERRFDRAITDFEQATILDPDYAVAFNNLGEAKGELRQYNQALEAFNRRWRSIQNCRVLVTTLDYLRANGNLKYSEFVFSSFGAWTGKTMTLVTTVWRLLFRNQVVRGKRFPFIKRRSALVERAFLLLQSGAQLSDSGRD